MRHFATFCGILRTENADFRGIRVICGKGVGFPLEQLYMNIIIMSPPPLCCVRKVRAYLSSIDAHAFIEC